MEFNSTDLFDSTEPPTCGKPVLNAAFPSDLVSEVYNMDCIQGMKEYPDKYFDLAIVDPPYGLGNRLSDGGGKLKNTPMAALYRDKDWDSLPDYEYWIELFRVSKNQVIFGANYFLDHLPATRGFICWDKKQDMPTLSACELVWTSFDKPAKIYKKVSTDLNRFHPTQKPVGIYDFCFLYAKVETGAKILDTHLGSGSSRISAYNMKFNFVGFELDKDYYEAQEKRFRTHISQQRLF
jgi:site-specific DNA-methyltransferase (adenine-specific)